MLTPLASKTRLAGFYVRKTAHWLALLLAGGLLLSLSGVSADSPNAPVYSEWQQQRGLTETDAARQDPLQDLRAINADVKIGSFTAVRRPAHETFFAGLSEYWQGSLRGAFSREALEQYARASARDKLVLNRDARRFKDWLAPRRERLLHELTYGAADYLTGRLVGQTENAARSLSFIRTVEWDYQSSLGERRWQTGLSALGALRHSADDAVVWQLRAYAAEDSAQGGSAGLIYRRAIGSRALIGVNAFLDYEQYGEHNEDFLRWSAGGEYKSAWLNLYANHYFPITDAVVAGDDYIYSRAGTDVELALRNPGVSWLSGGLTWYRWEGEYGDEDDTGLRYNLRLGPFGGGGALSGLELEVELEQPEGSDDVEWGGRVSYTRLLGQPEQGGARDLADITFDPRAHFFAPARREYSQRITRGGDGFISNDILVTLVSSADSDNEIRINRLAGAAVSAHIFTINMAYPGTVVNGDNTVSIATDPAVAAADPALLLSSYAGGWKATVLGDTRLQLIDSAAAISLTRGTIDIFRDDSSSRLRAVATPNATVVMVGTTVRVWHRGGANGTVGIEFLEETGGRGEVSVIAGEGVTRQDQITVVIETRRAGAAGGAGSSGGGEEEETGVVNINYTGSGDPDLRTVEVISFDCDSAAGRDSARQYNADLSCAHLATISSLPANGVIRMTTGNGEALTLRHDSGEIRVEGYGQRWQNSAGYSFNLLGFRPADITYEGDAGSEAVLGYVRGNTQGGTDAAALRLNGPVTRIQAEESPEGSEVNLRVREGRVTDIAGAQSSIDCGDIAAGREAGEAPFRINAACGAEVTFTGAPVTGLSGRQGIARLYEYTVDGGSGSYRYILSRDDLLRFTEADDSDNHVTLSLYSDRSVTDQEVILTVEDRLYSGSNIITAAVLRLNVNVSEEFKVNESSIADISITTEINPGRLRIVNVVGDLGAVTFSKRSGDDRLTLVTVGLQDYQAAVSLTSALDTPDTYSIGIRAVDSGGIGVPAATIDFTVNVIAADPVTNVIFSSAPRGIPTRYRTATGALATLIASQGTFWPGGPRQNYDYSDSAFPNNDFSIVESGDRNANAVLNLGAAQTAGAYTLTIVAKDAHSRTDNAARVYAVTLVNPLNLTPDSHDAGERSSPAADIAIATVTAVSGSGAYGYRINSVSPSALRGEFYMNNISVVRFRRNTNDNAAVTVNVRVTDDFGGQNYTVSLSVLAILRLRSNNDRTEVYIAHTASFTTLSAVHENGKGPFTYDNLRVDSSSAGLDATDFELDDNTGALRLKAPTTEHNADLRIDITDSLGDSVTYNLRVQFSDNDVIFNQPSAAVTLRTTDSGAIYAQAARWRDSSGGAITHSKGGRTSASQNSNINVTPATGEVIVANPIASPQTFTVEVIATGAGGLASVPPATLSLAAAVRQPARFANAEITRDLSTESIEPGFYTAQAADGAPPYTYGVQVVNAARGRSFIIDAVSGTLGITDGRGSPEADVTVRITAEDRGAGVYFDSANDTAVQTLILRLRHPAAPAITFSRLNSSIPSGETGEIARFSISGGYVAAGSEYAVNVTPAARLSVAALPGAGQYALRLHNTAGLADGDSFNYILTADDSHSRTAQASETRLLRIIDAYGGDDVYEEGDIYVIGGEIAGGDDRNDVWKSADAKTWTREVANGSGGYNGSAAGARYVNAVTYGGRIYVAGGETSGNQIHRSADGQTWEAITIPGAANLTSPGIQALNNTLLIFGGGSGVSEVWASTDGRNWRPHDNTFPAGHRFGDTVLDGVLYVAGGTSAGGGANGWSSTDGKNWTPLNNTPDVGDYAQLAAYRGALYLAGGEGADGGAGGTLNPALIHRSADGGAGWTTATLAAAVHSGAALLVHSGTLYYMGGSNATGSAGHSGASNDIWYTDNGADWQPLSATAGAIWEGRRFFAAVVFDPSAPVPDAQVPPFVSSLHPLTLTVANAYDGVVASVSVAGGIGAYSYVVADSANFQSADSEGRIRIRPSRNSGNTTLRLITDITARDSHSSTPDITHALTVYVYPDLAADAPDLNFIRNNINSRNNQALYTLQATGGSGNHTYAEISIADSLAPISFNAAAAEIRMGAADFAAPAEGTVSIRISDSGSGEVITAAIRVRVLNNPAVSISPYWPHIAAGAARTVAVLDVTTVDPDSVIALSGSRPSSQLRLTESAGRHYIYADNIAAGEVPVTVTLTYTQPSAGAAGDVWTLTVRDDAGYIPPYVIQIGAADNLASLIFPAGYSGTITRFTAAGGGSAYTYGIAGAAPAFNLHAASGSLTVANLPAGDALSRVSLTVQVSDERDDTDDSLLTVTLISYAPQTASFADVPALVGADYSGRVANVAVSGGAPPDYVVTFLPAAETRFSYDAAARALLADFNHAAAVTAVLTATLVIDDGVAATPPGTVAFSVTVLPPIVQSAAARDDFYPGRAAGDTVFALSPSGGSGSYTYTGGMTGAAAAFTRFDAAAGEVQYTAAPSAPAAGVLTVRIADVIATGQTVSVSIPVVLNNNLGSSEVFGSGRVYMLGGISGNGHNSGSHAQEIYYTADPTNATWTRDENANQGAGDYWFPQLVAFGGRLYQIGGRFNGAGTGSRHVWTTTDGENWTRQADFNAPAREQHRVIVFENQMWMLGGSGSGSSFRNDIWRSVDGSSWTEITPSGFPAIRNFATGILGGTVYVVGGRYSASSYNLRDVWTSADMTTWAKVTSRQLPSAVNVGEAPYGAVFNGKFYVIGGRYSNTLSDDVHVFDGAAWMRYNGNFGYNGSFGFRYNGGKAVAFGNALYIIGGQTDIDTSSGNSRSSEIWYSTAPDSGADWTLVNAGWANRRVHDVAVFDPDGIDPAAQIAPFSAAVPAAPATVAAGSSAAYRVTVQGGAHPYTFTQEGDISVLSLTVTPTGVSVIITASRPAAVTRYAVTAAFNDSSGLTDNLIISVAVAPAFVFAPPAAHTVRYGSGDSVPAGQTLFTFQASGGAGAISYSRQGAHALLGVSAAGALTLSSAQGAELVTSLTVRAANADGVSPAIDAVMTVHFEEITADLNTYWTAALEGASRVVASVDFSAAPGTYTLTLLAAPPFIRLTAAQLSLAAAPAPAGGAAVAVHTATVRYLDDLLPPAGRRDLRYTLSVHSAAGGFFPPYRISLTVPPAISAYDTDTGAIATVAAAGAGNTHVFALINSPPAGWHLASVNATAAAVSLSAPQSAGSYRLTLRVTDDHPFNDDLTAVLTAAILDNIIAVPEVYYPFLPAGAAAPQVVASIAAGNTAGRGYTSSSGGGGFFALGDDHLLTLTAAVTAPAVVIVSVTVRRADGAGNPAAAAVRIEFGAADAGAAAGEMYFYGLNDYSGDVWASADGRGTWRKISSGELPFAEMAGAYFQGSLYAFGGIPSGSTAQRHIYASADGADWTQVRAHGTNAYRGSRNIAGSRLVSSGSKLFSMGGVGGGATRSGYSGEIWTSTNGVSWANTGRMANGSGADGGDRPQALVHNGTLWMIGGSEVPPNSDLFNTASALNIHAYSTDEGSNWSQPTGRNFPADAVAGSAGRYNGGGAFFHYAGLFWLIGGNINSAAGEREYTDAIWYSADAIRWAKSDRRFPGGDKTNAASPGVTGLVPVIHHGAVYLVGGTDSGGAGGADRATGKVWQSTDGIVWHDVGSLGNHAGDLTNIGVSSRPAPRFSAAYDFELTHTAHTVALPENTAHNLAVATITAVGLAAYSYELAAGAGAGIALNGNVLSYNGSSARARLAATVHVRPLHVTDDAYRKNYTLVVNIYKPLTDGGATLAIPANTPYNAPVPLPSGLAPHNLALDAANPVIPASAASSVSISPDGRNLVLAELPPTVITVNLDVTDALGAGPADIALQVTTFSLLDAQIEQYYANLPAGVYGTLAVASVSVNVGAVSPQAQLIGGGAHFALAGRVLSLTVSAAGAYAATVRVSHAVPGAASITLAATIDVSAAGADDAAIQLAPAGRNAGSFLLKAGETIPVATMTVSGGYGTARFALAAGSPPIFSLAGSVIRIAADLDAVTGAALTVEVGDSTPNPARASYALTLTAAPPLDADSSGIRSYFDVVVAGSPALAVASLSVSSAALPAQLSVTLISGANAFAIGDDLVITMTRADAPGGYNLAARVSYSPRFIAGAALLTLEHRVEVSEIGGRVNVDTDLYYLTERLFPSTQSRDPRSDVWKSIDDGATWTMIATNYTETTDSPIRFNRHGMALGSHNGYLFYGFGAIINQAFAITYFNAFNPAIRSVNGYSEDGISWNKRVLSEFRSDGVFVSAGSTLAVLGGMKADFSNNRSASKEVWYNTGAAPGSGTWRKHDNDGPWTAARPTALYHNGTIWIAGGTGAPIYGGSINWISGGGVERGTNDHWYSADGGASWTDASDGTDPFGVLGGAAFVHFRDKFWLFGGSSSGGIALDTIWSSADGKSWNQETNRLPRTLTHPKVAVHKDKLYLMAGRTFGVGDANNTNMYVSSDGTNWTRQSHNLPSSAYTGTPAPYGAFLSHSTGGEVLAADPAAVVITPAVTVINIAVAGNAANTQINSRPLLTIAASGGYGDFAYQFTADDAGLTFNPASRVIALDGSYPVPSALTATVRVTESSPNRFSGLLTLSVQIVPQLKNERVTANVPALTAARYALQISSGAPPYVYDIASASPAAYTASVSLESGGVLAVTAAAAGDDYTVNVNVTDALGDTAVLSVHVLPAPTLSGGFVQYFSEALDSTVPLVVASVRIDPGALRSSVTLLAGGGGFAIGADNLLTLLASSPGAVSATVVLRHAVAADAVTAAVTVNVQSGARPPERLFYYGQSHFSGGALPFAVWGSADGSSWDIVAEDYLTPKRTAPAAGVYDGKLWLIGGESDSGTRLDDVWNSADGRNWRPVSQTPGKELPAMKYSRMVVHNSRMLLAAGYADETGRSSPDTGKSRIYSSADGAAWTVISTVTYAAAGRRESNVLVHKGTVWLIGGYNPDTEGGASYAERWASADGVTWAPVTDGSFPSSGSGKGRAFPIGDFDGKMWLFGGHRQTYTYTDSIWSSADGETWNKASQIMPSEMLGAAITRYGGSLMILAGNSGQESGSVITSTDGLTWNSGAAVGFLTEGSYLVSLTPALPPDPTDIVLAQTTDTVPLAAGAYDSYAVATLQASGGAGGGGGDTGAGSDESAYIYSITGIDKDGADITGDPAAADITLDGSVLKISGARAAGETFTIQVQVSDISPSGKTAAYTLVIQIE